MKLKVWWIPQVPMKPFEYPVNTVLEAKILLDALGKYDAFQFENNIKPDYCNAGGLQMFDEDAQEWYDWESEGSGENINDLSYEYLAAIPLPPPNRNDLRDFRGRKRTDMF